jgi:Domain of unknown function (DUF2017)
VSAFRPTSDGVIAKFDRTDARLLADLATQLATLLAGRDETTPDAAVRRLLPDAYRDSAEDAAEFRRFTEEDLADAKIRSALAMSETLTIEGVDDKVRVKLERATAIDWMRSLTDIRLALAARLGIVDDTSPIVESDETRYTLAIYNWLGALQFSLVRAVDR